MEREHRSEEALQIEEKDSGVWVVSHQPSVKRLPPRSQKPLISYRIEQSLLVLLLSPLFLVGGLVLINVESEMGIKLLLAGALGLPIALIDHYYYYRIMPSWLGGRIEFEGREFQVQIWGRKKSMERELKGELEGLRVEFWPPLKGEETGLARFFHRGKLATLELLLPSEQERLRSFLEERGVETTIREWEKKRLPKVAEIEKG